MTGRRIIWRALAGPGLPYYQAASAYAAARKAAAEEGRVVTVTRNGEPYTAWTPAGVEVLPWPLAHLEED
jgi:hypothetical protein